MGFKSVKKCNNSFRLYSRGTLFSIGFKFNDLFRALRVEHREINKILFGKFEGCAWDGSSKLLLRLGVFNEFDSLFLTHVDIL